MRLLSDATMRRPLARVPLILSAAAVGNAGSPQLALDISRLLLTGGSRWFPRNDKASLTILRLARSRGWRCRQRSEVLIAGSLKVMSSQVPETGSCMGAGG